MLTAAEFVSVPMIRVDRFVVAKAKAQSGRYDKSPAQGPLALFGSSSGEGRI